MTRLPLAVLTLASALATACGGGSKNPVDPGSASSSGCFAVVGNQGTITATISGLAPFNGIVGTGAAVLVPGVVPTFTVGAINVQDGSGVIVTGRGQVGTTAIGPSTLNSNASSNSLSVQTRSCSAGTGNWVANVAFGSGTLTVTSFSTTSVAGSFTATLEAGPGFSGTKTISGSFNATF